MLGQEEQAAYQDEQAAASQPQAPRFVPGGATLHNHQYCAVCYWHWSVHDSYTAECPPPGCVSPTRR